MLVAVRATIQLNTIETSSMENESEANIRMHNIFFRIMFAYLPTPKKRGPSTNRNSKPPLKTILLSCALVCDLEIWIIVSCFSGLFLPQADKMLRLLGGTNVDRNQRYM